MCLDETAFEQILIKGFWHVLHFHLPRVDINNIFAKTKGNAKIVIIQYIGYKPLILLNPYQILFFKIYIYIIY